MKTMAQAFGEDVKRDGLGAALGNHFHLIDPNGCSTSLRENTLFFEDGSRFRFFWRDGFTTDKPVGGTITIGSA